MYHQCIPATHQYIVAFVTPGGCQSIFIRFQQDFVMWHLLWPYNCKLTKYTLIHFIKLAVEKCLSTNTWVKTLEFMTQNIYNTVCRWGGSLPSGRYREIKSRTELRIQCFGSQRDQFLNSVFFRRWCFIMYRFCTYLLALENNFISSPSLVNKEAQHIFLFLKFI